MGYGFSVGRIEADGLDAAYDRMERATMDSEERRNAIETFA